MGRNKSGILGILVCAAMVYGCTARGVTGTAWQQPPPAGRDEPEIASGPTETEEANGVLTLRKALSLALMRNPELSAFSWEVRAGESRTLQAGLFPNPEAGIEVEDIGGSDAFSGLDAAQTTISLSQLIELGDKRRKRARVAALDRDLAVWDYEAKRLDVLTEVTRNFIDVLGAQRQMTYSEEMVRLAEATLRTVSERVNAGKVSPLEATKAGVSLSTARIEHKQAGNRLAAARRKLAAAWASSSPGFERVEGNLDSLLPVPSAESLLKHIAGNPDIARWVNEMEQRAVALELEKAKRIPDLTVSGGFRRFSETDDHAFVVGVSVPIPIFNQNQGGVLEASRKLVKAKEESRAAEARISASLAQFYQSLASSYEQSMSIRNEVLPAAEHVFKATGEGYREGKFDFLDFVDAQRSLFEAKAKYLESLVTYHKTKADVERLIGDSLDSIPRTSEEKGKGTGHE